MLVSIIARDGLPRKMLVKDVEQVERRRHTALACDRGEAIASTARRTRMPDEAGVRVSAGGMDVFIEPLALRPTVVLFGAGHVSCHIARFAQVGALSRVGLRRPGRIRQSPSDSPMPTRSSCEDFARVFDRVRIDERSYLVIVTRGHQHDAVVLEQAVRTDARYIGMIGSKRKTLTLLEKLRDKGVSKERLDRVYSPIGIAIGAVTAEEIALSIVCELVKIRRLGDEAQVGHMSSVAARGRA